VELRLLFEVDVSCLSGRRKTSRPWLYNIKMTASYLKTEELEKIASALQFRPYQCEQSPFRIYLKPIRDSKIAFDAYQAVAAFEPGSHLSSRSGRLCPLWSTLSE
jgi:hypothetical protein